MMPCRELWRQEDEQDLAYMERVGEEDKASARRAVANMTQKLQYIS